MGRLLIIQRPQGGVTQAHVARELGLSRSMVVKSQNRSQAHTESKVDSTDSPSTMVRSTCDVMKPHQPRTLTSIASIPVPAQDSENPASAGKSTDRPHGPGGLMAYDIFVILRTSMTIADGGKWRLELGCGGATWLLGPDPH